ncbi:2-dehydropantoate 2-reductase N-terminal domain-containing protein [Paenibacillus sp. FSL R5-0887]|uniref:ketopantoate reductase family protein n=1 Tax=Paenibacillus TaxID=44249 RepID=UPI00096E8DB2|nr:2-dehydropantoate 2-reductase N-terminal domain-containing protein [Paenibacillus odorifer]OMC76783.1 ketopantoate reductase [Paenibacillus odorifer]OMD64718.1 ketopantoate reductase [Paenibacillus odorifer]
MTITSDKTNILIVGAGAVGFSVGYHLHLSGTDVTFLVRKGRKADFAPPQKLYCYDDATLKDFSNFNVIEDIEEIEPQQYQFIIITLDGNVSRSPEGVATLSKLGDVVRNSKTTVIMSAFGSGIREHYIQYMRLPEDQLLRGILGTLSHQSKADLPVHAPTDPKLINQAIVCYKHPANKVGFQVENNNKSAAKQFSALYNNSGVSRCGQVSPAMFNIYSSIGFPVYAACDIVGWPKFSAVIANKDLWQLACRAQGEIASLPKHGLIGKIMSFVMGPRMTAKIHLKMEQDMLPLDYQAFNRFHHGGKVKAQDVESIRNSIVEGELQGRQMKALKELLQRVEHN